MDLFEKKEGIARFLRRNALLLPTLCLVLCLFGLKESSQGINTLNHSWGLCFSLLLLTLGLLFASAPKRFFFLTLLLCLWTGTRFIEKEKLYTQQQTALQSCPLLSFEGSLLKKYPTGYVLEGYPLFQTKSPSTNKAPFNSPCKLLIKSDFTHSLEVGKSYLIEGQFLPLRVPRHKGEFDTRHWFWQEGFVAQFREISCQEKGEGNLKSQVLAASQALQNSLSQHLSFPQKETLSLPKEEAQQTLRALVWGAKNDASPELIESFKQTGLLHFFAVSGLHVGFFLLFCSLLLWVLPLSFRLQCLLLLLGLAFYAVTTGLSLSALRATLFFSFWLLARLFLRPTTALNRLCLALLVFLLWDPQSLFLLSAQLTFGVFLAVLLASKSLPFLKELTRPDAFLPASFYTREEKFFFYLKYSLLFSLFISFCAWAMASLILASYTHFVPLYAPFLTSLLSFPLLVLMSLGFLSVLFTPFAWLKTLLLSLCLWGAQKFVALNHFAQYLPGAQVPLAAPAPAEQCSLFSQGEDSYVAVLGNPALILETGNSSFFPFSLKGGLLAYGYLPSFWTCSHLHTEESQAAPALALAYPQLKALPFLPTGRPLKLGKNITLTRFDTGSAQALYRGPADNHVSLFLWQSPSYNILFLGDAPHEALEKWHQEHPELHAPIVVLGKHSFDLPPSPEALLSLNVKTLIFSGKIPPLYHKVLSAKGIRLYSLQKEGQIILPLP